MSSITNKTNGIIVSGSANNDVITNTASKVSINGGAGNDSVRSTGGTGVTINGGPGNDTLTGSSNADIFQFSYGSGSDIITNFGANDTLNISSGAISTYYSDGNDLIVKVKSDNTTGTLRMKNAADIPVKVKVGSKAVTTINAVKDICNLTSNTVVSGTTSRDVIFNYSPNVTVNSAASKDTIINAGNYVSLNGGAGNDFIHNIYGEYVTINGGTGNDSINISYSNSVIQFQSNGGKDTIVNANTYDTINIVDGSVSSYYVKDGDMIVSVKGAKNSGSIRLEGYGDNPIQILNAAGALETINPINYIYNSESHTVVNGTNIKDHITNYSEADSVTINAAEGNDVIYNDDLDNGSVNGGAGNDSIRGYYYHSTINGGTGNDTLDNSSNGNYNVYQFASNGGKDVITNFGENDTLHITAGSISTYYPNGTDLVVSVKGSNSSGVVTLKDAAIGVVNVRDSSGKMSTISGYNYIENYESNKRVNGSTGKDYIYNNAYYVTINAGADNDVVNNSGYSVSINGGAGNDSIGGNAYSSTLRGGAGNDTISVYSNYKTYQFGASDGNDIITNFYENDTIRITSGTVVSNQYNGNDYVISVKDSINSGSITIKDIDRLTPIRVRTSKRTSIVNYAKNNSKSNTTVSGTKNADRIFNDGDSVKINAGDGNDVIYNGNRYYYTSATINAGAGNDTVYLNNINSGSVNAGAGNDYIEGSYNSSTIAGGAGNDTVWGGESSNVYKFGATDGNDLIYGFGYTDTLNITSGSLSSYDYINSFIINGEDYGSAVVLNIKSSSASSSVTLLGNDKDSPIVIRDANGKMSVLNYDLFNFDSTTIVSGTNNADKIFNKGERSTINAGNGNDTIYDYAYSDVINGGTGNDYVYTNNSSNTINGGNGNDTIYSGSSENSINGGAGNDYIYGYYYYSTLRGGAGNDTINAWGDYKLYQFGSGDGNDLITSFYETDTIQITSGTITSFYAVNDGGEEHPPDYVIEVGSSSKITIQGLVDYPIRVIEGNTMRLLNSTDTGTTLVSYIDNTVFSGTDNADNIYNTASNVTIRAGKDNDSIYNEGINVTFEGGKGNDTIQNNYWGGAYNVYRFGATDGNDLLIGFAEDDTLQITNGAVDDYYANGDDFVVEVKNGNNTATVTLQGMAYSRIAVRNTKGKMQYLITDSYAELPAPSPDEYWFDETAEVKDDLDRIMTVKDNAVDMPTDFNDAFKQSRLELAANARHRQKK